VTVWQRAKELYDELIGVDVIEAPHTGVEVNQEIAKVAKGGEVTGARIEKLVEGEIRSDQKVDVVGEGGRATGVSVRRLG